MKILFVQPPLGAWATWGTHKAINIGHAQLAGFLRQHNPDLELAVLDCRAHGLTEAQMLEKVGESGADIIYLGDILHTTGGLAVVFIYNEAARKIKERYPHVKIIVGGIFYASASEFTMKENPHLDFCIAGEAELTLSELLKELAKSKPDIAGVKGICWRDNGKAPDPGLEYFAYAGLRPVPYGCLRQPHLLEELFGDVEFPRVPGGLYLLL